MTQDLLILSLVVGKTCIFFSSKAVTSVIALVVLQDLLLSYLPSTLGHLNEHSDLECQTVKNQRSTDILSVLIWVQTVCKGYQPKTKVIPSIERVKQCYLEHMFR